MHEKIWITTKDRLYRSVGGKGGAGAVWSNASAKHMAERGGGVGGVVGFEREQHKPESLTQSCSRKQLFLKGQQHRGSGTLQTTCTTCSADHATTNRSHDQEVTINPCLAEPRSWNGDVHVVPD